MVVTVLILRHALIGLELSVNINVIRFITIRVTTMSSQNE